MNCELHFLVVRKMLLGTMNFEPDFVDFPEGNGKCCGHARMRETFCLSCAIGSLPVLSIFLREYGKCCGQPRMHETFCLSCATGSSRLPVLSIFLEKIENVAVNSACVKHCVCHAPLGPRGCHFPEGKWKMLRSTAHA